MKFRVAKKVITRGARSPGWDGGYRATTMKEAVRVMNRYYKRGMRAAERRYGSLAKWQMAMADSTLHAEVSDSHSSREDLVSDNPSKERG